jgi:hypothetical protein
MCGSGQMVLVQVQKVEASFSGLSQERAITVSFHPTTVKHTCEDQK